jgi:hypothetical protein
MMFLGLFFALYISKGDWQMSLQASNFLGFLVRNSPRNGAYCANTSPRFLVSKKDWQLTLWFS